MSTYYRSIFLYTVSTYKTVIETKHHLTGVHEAMEVLAKLLSVYKTRSYVDLYSLLRLIFYCLSLIDHYKFLIFIQQYNLHF